MGEYSVDDLNNLFGAQGSKPDSISVDSMQHLAESHPVSYTPPEEKPTGNIVSGTVKGLVKTPQILGSFLSYLGHNFDPDENEDQIRVGNSFGDRMARLGIEMTEKNKAYIAQKFPETPNLWEKIGEGVGGGLPLAAALGIGALTGADEAALTAIAAGGIAATTNLSTFEALKAKGTPTVSADLLSLLPAGAAGGLTLLGFGAFLKIGGAPLEALAKSTLMGFTTMFSQSAAAGEIQHLEGANEGKFMDRLAQYAVDGVVGAIFGGTVGTYKALELHGRIVDSLMEAGANPEQAKDMATVLMSKMMGKGLAIAEAKTGTTAQDEGRLNSLNEKTGDLFENQGTSLDSQYPPIAQEPKPAGEVAALSRNNKYVLIDDMKIKQLPTDKETAALARAEFSGALKKALDRGAYLREDMKLLAPENEQAAVTLHEGTWGDKDLIRRLIEEPEKVALEKQKSLHDRLNPGEPFEPDLEKISKVTALWKSLRPYFEQALNPTEGMLKVIEEGRIFHRESGEVGKAFGTLHDFLANYEFKRLYKPDKTTDFVKSQSRTGLPQFTPSALQRVYADIYEAMADGKEMATLNYADLVGAKNQEMAVVNVSRQLLDIMNDMKPSGLVKWMLPGRVPDNWKQVGTLMKEGYMRDGEGNLVLNNKNDPILLKHIAVAPEGIADGLKAVTDPDKLREIPGLKTFQKLQGIDKTFDLAFSVFHPVTFLHQALTAPGGFGMLMDYPRVFNENLMVGEEFRAHELDAAADKVVTTKSNEMQDIIRDMNKGDDVLSKALQLPVAKQITDAAQGYTSWMFDNLQRYLKVETHYNAKEAWKQNHPDATPEEIHTAGQAIGDWVNSHYGGLNWEALGVTKSVQSMMRTIFLAPDWLTAMATNAAYATTDWKGGLFEGTGGNARLAFIKSISGGFALGNALNIMLTGHPMWDNKKGHKFDIQMAPDVYFAPIRGPVGEVVKLAADMWESGGPHGFFRYAEGKLAPLTSAGLMLASGVNYYGGNIWKGKTPLQQNVTAFWNVFSRVMPVPFGVTGMFNYLQREKEQSLLGFGAVATGFGRFSKPGGKQSSFESQLKSELFKSEWYKQSGGI